MATQPKRATRTRKYGPSWVSKTDLIDYVRCPYAFWLSDQGLVSRRDMVSEAVRKLAAEGVQFQAGVESRATPIEVSPKALPRLLRKEGILLNTPLFENKSLKIYGRPDGIDAARGGLIPGSSGEAVGVERPLREANREVPRRPDGLELSLATWHAARIATHS
jgi:hypothetical protein